ncbi:MAG: phosphate ABC transporter permease PstA [Mycoplasmoidaceae bacterium]
MNFFQKKNKDKSINTWTQYSIFSNRIFKYLTIFAAFLLVIILFVMFSFILYEAVHNSKISLANILFTNIIDFSQKKCSFWLPFSVTIITSTIALLIAAPLGVKTATFIKFRINKKHQNKIRIFFYVLSGIPSVIFGLFALTSLGTLFQHLFGISPSSILIASIMLAFMITPTIISMTFHNLDNINKELITNPMSLGTSKTRSIYKVYLKAARPGIIVACTIAFTRAISESIALSMILNAQPNNWMFSSLSTFFNGNFQTIGAFLASQMFSENNVEVIQPALFTFGLILFIISILMNIFLVSVQSKKSNKYKWVLKMEIILVKIIFFIPNQFLIFYELVTYRSKKGHKINSNNLNDSILYVKERIYDNKLKNLFTIKKMTSEVISFIFSISFILWICMDIVVKGSIASKEPNTILQYSKNDIGQSFVNTIIVIWTSIIISMPISLLVAIYLNEYARDGKIKKSIIFFADSIATTPSILFGMFGMLFFIQTLGLSAGGKTGNSLIAGSLTLSIVIVPTFIRLLQQALENIPLEFRTNSIALGNTKFFTIRRLIIPAAITGIITSLVLSIGRILSETAPLYLTAGLSSSWHSALNRPGTTLTTYIYSQLFSNDSNIERNNYQYQAALLIFIIVFALVFIGYVIIPNWKEVKKTTVDIFKDCYASFLNLIGKKRIDYEKN